MPKWIKSVLMTVAGTALVLAWWTIKGPGPDNTQRVKGIPPQVWGGTAGPLQIRAKVSAPAELSIVFERQKPGGNEADHEILETRQDIAPGEHSVSVQVPPAVMATVQIQMHNPPVGANFSWSVLVGGQEMHQGSDTLDKPLDKGYGFFDNIEFDDVAAGKLSD